MENKFSKIFFFHKLAFTQKISPQKIVLVKVYMPESDFTKGKRIKASTFLKTGPITDVTSDVFPIFSERKTLQYSC